MFKYDVLSRQQSGPSRGDPLYLQPNCFLLFCRDSTILIFPTLLADFNDPIQKTGQVFHPVGKVTYCSCPLYSFSLL